MDTSIQTLCQLAEKDLDLVRQKAISSKYSYFAIHFTDISFLPSILSKGINYAQSTYNSIECVKEITGKEYSEALGTYRYINESAYNEKYYGRNKTDRIEYIGDCFDSQSFFMRLLEKTNLRTSSELDIIKRYQKKYLVNDKKLDFLEENDISVLYELAARVFARNNYVTFFNDYDEFQSSMNVALLFDKDSIHNPTNVFGMSNIYKGSSVIQVEPNSKIKGIMVYEANLNETVKIVLENSKTIEDIMPVYNYDGNLLWPRV